ncbi:hypothetical protein ABMC89_11200 [Sulfitobacter sp. HNIBRBA3233]|uniref:hypothetical protein n=1 Tax=Sulfitobacter marinivivus TaxID=3158558 RepID=UPI0032DFCA2F
MPIWSFRALTAAITVVATVSAVQADDNRLFITQDSSIGGAGGNTLFVDQSLATNSTISGALDSDTPAQQIGGGNTAQVNIANTDGRVALNQITTDGGTTGNNANVNLSGLLATGVLTQVGIDNDGRLNVSGDGASGFLEQRGDGNTGFVEVTGARAVGRLLQNGNNNSTGLSVTGAGADVTLTQNGNNIITAPSVVPSVTTNGGRLTINQTFSN